MERTEHRFTLDVQKIVANYSVALKRAETAHRLLISLTEGGKPYSIGEDCRAVFSAAKPDGTSLFNECAIEDGVVIYDISEETTAVTGVIGCEIMIYGGEGELLTSATFLIIVWERSANPVAVVSSDEFTALARMIYAASVATNEAEEAAKQAREAKENGEFDGKDGAPGGYYRPSVDADGNLGWTSVGNAGPEPKPVNIRGPEGPKGASPVIKP